MRSAARALLDRRGEQSRRSGSGRRIRLAPARRAHLDRLREWMVSLQGTGVDLPREGPHPRGAGPPRAPGQLQRSLPAERLGVESALAGEDPVHAAELRVEVQELREV